MKQTWGSTGLGQLFTRSAPWTLTVDDAQFTLHVAGRVRTGSVLLLDKLEVRHGAFWAAVHLAGANDQVMRLDGVTDRHIGASP